MIAIGGLNATASELLSQLVGGSTSNEARLRLLERRITGQIGDLSNAAIAPQNLASGFDAVAGGPASLARAGSAPQPAAVYSAAPVAAGDDNRNAGTNAQLGLKPQPVAGERRGSNDASTAAQAAVGSRSPGNKRRRVVNKSPEGQASDANMEDAVVAASPVTNQAPDIACQTPGTEPQAAKRTLASTTTTAAGANGAATSGVLARFSPHVGKPTPRGRGAGVARGQTKVSTFFPAIDTNSRDSRDSDQGGGMAAAAERASAAAVAAMQGTGAARLPSVTEVLHEEKSALLQQQLELKEQELKELRQQLNFQSQQLQEHKENATGEAASLRRLNEELQHQLKEVSRQAAERESRLRSEISRVLKSGTRSERELQRLQLSCGASRLGGVAVQRTGPIQVQEVWEDGQAHHQIAQKQLALTQQREELEASRKALRKKLAPPPSARGQQQQQQGTSTAGESSSLSTQEVPPTPEFMSGPEFMTMDEIYKLRLAALKREEEAVRQEEERLNTEKMRHIRLLKRTRDEAASRFSGMEVLADRYQLLNLLGKGGFSEVYKAYDLQELRHVACKIHQLNPHWSEPKKQSYVKHAIREYDIHKTLRHPHIVGLLDIKEIDCSSFATVLDLCEGPDLDTVLREHGTLPEKEARAIIAQVFSALVHLNQPRHRIIHYDLKPANILLDSLGLAKVTDFGLSKVVEEGQTMGMELTSQGAGTYWYLPPECFEIGPPGQAPRISNKVDVWSAGIILYQMLIGRRPFGEGMTQEQIMRDRVMLNAREVEFPSKPSVSADAKEFIRKCLAYRQENRWDVLTAAQDPFLCLTKSAAAAAAGGQQSAQQGTASGRRGATTGFGGLLKEIIQGP